MFLPSFPESLRPVGPVHAHRRCRPSRDLFLRTVKVAPALAGARLEVADLSERDAAAVLRGCARVRRVAVVAPRTCPRAAAAVVRHYAEHAEALDLQLGQCDAAAEILAAIAAARSLRTLRLAGELRGSPDDPALAAAARGCPLLEVLDVEGLDCRWAAQWLAEVAAVRGGGLTGLVLPGRHCVVSDAILQQV